MATETVSEPTSDVGKAVNDAPVEKSEKTGENRSDSGKSPSGPGSVRKKLVVAAIAILALASVFYLWPRLHLALTTISTDDAYVNGHVTFVAPRVAGQVLKVMVDDNQRVRKGDVLVQLDPEPYRVTVEISKAAVGIAEANLAQADAQVHSLIAQARAHRFNLEYSIDHVKNQIANLQANVATLNSMKAQLDLSKSNLKRGEDLGPGGAISQEELDLRRQTVNVDAARVDEALQQVYSTRASLGLPSQPPQGQELGSVPEELPQDYSSVREALAQLIQSIAQIGYYQSDWNASPRKAVEEFYKQDPKGDLNHIYERLIPNAPQIKQAEAQLLQAKRDLEQAELNLSYCNIVSEIDGVVTRRNVNPGNNVQVGQSLMAVRSLTEIWVDANFKETQLKHLRIGQRVVLDVDMYGSESEFEGRITGFTMGTGQTLALLPPQNATGNFVKVVQRLPVRIELTNYDPEKRPLFIGLSVEPHVHYKDKVEGPNSGEFLQEIMPSAPAASPTNTQASSPEAKATP